MKEKDYPLKGWSSQGTDPIHNTKFNTVVEVNKLLAEHGITKFWFELGGQVNMRFKPSLFSRLKYRWWVFQQRHNLYLRK